MESNNNILKIKHLLSAGLVTLSLFLGSLFPGNLLPGNLLSGHLLSGYLSGSLQAFAAESSVKVIPIKRNQEEISVLPSTLISLMLIVFPCELSGSGNRV